MAFLEQDGHAVRVQVLDHGQQRHGFKVLGVEWQPRLLVQIQLEKLDPVAIGRLLRHGKLIDREFLLEHGVHEEIRK